MNEAVVGCGDQSMKQLFATHPELEDGLLIGRLNFFSFFMKYLYRKTYVIKRFLGKYGSGIMYTVRKNTIYMKVKSGISGTASSRFRRAIKAWQKLRIDFKTIFKFAL